MNPFIYVLLLVCTVVSAISTFAQSSVYTSEMETLLTQYDNADDAGKKAALEAMTALDKDYNGRAIIKMWKELDKETATGADYRRIGIAMAAGREKEACKWCFRRGAELGDPYCANLVLIEQLTELNNPDAAMYLFPKIKSFTMPLLHNMALALYVLDTPESRKIAHSLADSFFALYDDKANSYNVCYYTEYVSYADSEILKAAGKCWQISPSTPTSALRKFHEKSM